MAVSPTEEHRTDASVLRLREVAGRRSAQDADLVTTAGDVVGATREVLVERKDLIGVELGKTQERTLMAEVKRLAVAEVQVAIGFGITEAQQLVAVATCAGDLRTILLDAMRQGRASWAMVRAFWSRTASLDDEQRMLVAQALFGTDPWLAAPERLDPDDSFHDGPWEHGQFHRALDREATACASADPGAELERRQRAYRRRRASFRAHDDGTGTLTITGPLVSLFAVWLRLDRAARSLRARGDERTLTQGRYDLAAALLLFATVTLPGKDAGGDTGEGKGQDEPGPVSADDASAGPSEDEQSLADGAQDEAPPGASEQSSPDPGDAPDPDMTWADEVLAPDDLAQLVRVINAQPTVHLNVVLPYSTLVGGFPMCAGCSRPTHRPEDQPTGPGPQEECVPQEECACNDSQEGCACNDSQEGCACGRSSQVPGGEDPASGKGPSPRSGSGIDQDRDDSKGRRGGAAEVLGPMPFWITDGHARELALWPDTMLHRFVTDPYDGRFVERTIEPYKPDTDMRRQVIAADLYSRAPGSRTTGAHAGQLDHVIPYGWGGGKTSELNLALLAIPPHQFKTLGHWKVEIGTRRDMTFTTLLGQVTRSRVHDYRQYLERRLNGVDAGGGAGGETGGGGSTGAGGEAGEDGSTGAEADARSSRGTEPERRRWARRDLASRAVYAALAAQDEHRLGPTRSQRQDDRDRLLVTHTDPATGAERTGPPEEPDTLQDVLDLDEQPDEDE